MINGKPVAHQAIPAEDMMHAFIYHHLIPTEELMLSNVETRLQRSPAEYQSDVPLKLQPGKSAALSFSTPTTFNRFQVQLDVEPRNLPLGVEITDVSIKPGLIEITLSIDASAGSGVEGNLLFDLLIERKRVGTNLREGSQETVRIEAGTLPAVPFRIL